MMDQGQIWIVIVGLGLGSFLLRFLFLGLVGRRPLPGWMMRHLRYTAVAVIPALIAPLVLWPPATGGQVDPLRLAAAVATLAAGFAFRNFIASILVGAAVMAAGYYWA